MDNDSLRHFVREAGFVFRGRKLPETPGEPPPVPAGAGETVAMHIDRVLRSTGALSDLAGQPALVLTKDAALLRAADTVILFTEVLSVGRQLLVRELGHAEATAETLSHLEQAIREESERPLSERVAAAELIVSGEVVESRTLERPYPPPSEHYPDWGIARVAVGAVLKGHDTHAEVEVLFAASLDRVWFHSPKLRSEVRGILLLFRIDKDERPPREMHRNGWQALDPLDLQPLERREEIERLIGGGRGAH
ncbi:MAG: hypothetical protein ACREE5_06645 [Acetobacteraceae bacterium]